MAEPGRLRVAGCEYPRPLAIRVRAPRWRGGRGICYRLCGPTSSIRSLRCSTRPTWWVRTGDDARLGRLAW